MKTLLRTLLLIVGALLIVIAIYGFYFFVIDFARLVKVANVDPDLSQLNAINFPRRQYYIVGFVDSLQHLAFGLLCLFAATKLKIVKNHD